MAKLSKAEVQVLWEISCSPGKALRKSTLAACASGLGIAPRSLPLVLSRLKRLGLVEELASYNPDDPRWLTLTNEGELKHAEMHA